MPATEVDIPVFLHPHLFWIFQNSNLSDRKKIERELEEEYQYLLQSEKEFFVGELVAVKNHKRNIWCRGVIEDILDNDSHKFEIFLIDYGYLFRSNLVYKLHQKYKSKPALVKQASLHNVVFLDETLNLENSCIEILKLSKPNAGATLCALQFLKDYILFFDKRKERNGIFFGDVLFKKDGRTKSLTNVLIQENIMVKDEQMFTAVEDSRIYDKDFHMHALRQASKNLKDESSSKNNVCYQMQDIFTRSSARGLSLGGSYNSESLGESEKEDKNVQKPKLSKFALCRKLCRKSVNTNTDTSCTESEFEESFQQKTDEEIQEKKPEIKEQSISLSETENSSKDNSIDFSSFPFAAKRAPKLFHAPVGRRDDRKGQKTTKSYFSDSTLSTDNKRQKLNLKTSSVSSKDSSPNDKNMTSGENFHCSIDLETSKSDNCENDREKPKKNDLESKSSQSDPDWREPKHTGVNDAVKGLKMKPFCSCKQCQHWSGAEGWTLSAEEFPGENIKKELTNIVRPTSLLIRGKRNNEVKMSSIRYRSMSKIEKQAHIKVLIHSQILPTRVERLTEALFHPIVYRAMKLLGYSRARRVQSYVWPAITRQMNVAYVHGDKKGKTMAYLPPLCSFLLDKDEVYEDLKKGGPIVVVLGSNSEQCEVIYDLAWKLLGGAGNKRPRVLLVTYPFQHINMSSVDMLITIPPVLIELLKKNATNLKRLCHLVFEDANVMFDKYKEEIYPIVGGVESMLQHRIGQRGVQTIMSGDHWTVELENFARRLRDPPMICVADPLEAALYGRVKMKQKYIETSAKRDFVVETLRDNYKYMKTVIICNNETEVEELKTTLTLASISFVAVTSDLSKEDALQLEANWQLQEGGAYRVLLCTDTILHTMLTITDAACIVNYSLPGSWTSFTRRYNCLLENLKCPLINDSNKLVCEAYILIDRSCEAESMRLLSQFENYKVSMKQYGEIFEQYKSNEEKKKIDLRKPLCDNLKLFGRCHAPKCPDRHVLDEDLDLTYNTLPKNGTVKFKIVELTNVNRLKVRIIEQKDRSEVRSDAETIDADEKLTSLFEANRRTKVAVKDPRRNGSYAFWDTDDFDDVFRECVVEDVKEDSVAVFLKGTARRMVVNKCRLFELPDGWEEISENASTTTEMIIAGFVPPYKDLQFSSRAFLKLKSVVDDLRYDDNLFVANVCLKLGDTLWVNDVTEEVDLENGAVRLCRTDLTRLLVKQKLADVNPGHMEALYALCAQAGIVLPEYKVVGGEEGTKRASTAMGTSQVAPQWAFLDMEQIDEVIFSGGVSPQEFYVRLAKFDDLLVRLETDLSDAARRQTGDREFSAIPNRCYIAKDHVETAEEKYGRVLVKRVENDSALCYWVDHGDETVCHMNDLFRLPHDLIRRLPFQAIQCRLHGSKAIDGEWQDEALGLLYDKYTFVNGTNIFRTLYCKCAYSERGINRGQSKFSVLLKDAQEPPVLINQLLIDCGWAEQLCNIDDFEIPKREESDVDIDIDVFSIEEDDKYVKDREEAEDIFRKTNVVDASIVKKDEVYGQPMEQDADTLMEAFFGEDSEEEMEQFISFMTSMMNATEERERQRTPFANRLPAIEAAPIEVDHLTPDIYWSQTIDSVRLSVKIPNVQSYKVKVNKSRIFIFETTTSEEKKYAVNMMLFETVEKDIEHKVCGLEIRVVLRKKQQMEWTRLSSAKKRLRNVHYMLGKEEMEEEEKERLFLDLGEEFDLSSGDEDEDEDNLMYQVVSDMDSEYDMDLEEDSD